MERRAVGETTRGTLEKLTSNTRRVPHVADWPARYRLPNESFPGYPSPRDIRAIFQSQ